MSRRDPFSNLEYFLPFEIISSEKGACSFVFNVQKVKEVLDFETSNSLPPVYFPFIGLIDLRGTPLPLLTLEFFLGDGKWSKEDAIEANQRDWRGYKIIVLDLQGYYIGVVAQSIGRILDPKTIQYLPSPDTLGMRSSSYINGMLRRDENLYYLLDIEAILSDLNGGVIEKSKLEDNQKISFEGKNVLVAEDSSLFRKKADQLFRSFGFNVTLANDGESALRLVKSSPKVFDLIFTDIEMPIRNGVSFIREVKKIPTAKDIPVIFNSSLSNEGLIRDIQSEGLGNYIIKYDEKKIFEVLSELLHSEPKKAAA